MQRLIPSPRGLPPSITTPRPKLQGDLLLRQVTITQTSTHVPGTSTILVTSTSTPIQTASFQTSTVVNPTSTTQTSSQLPTVASAAGGGPKSSPLLFFVVLALACVALIGIGICIGYCVIRRRRRRREIATVNTAPGHELQPTTATTAGGNEIQPPAQSEVYGYYAPVGGGRNVKSPPISATQEAYGHFAPSVAPRVGDAVVVPATRGRWTSFARGGWVK